MSISDHLRAAHLMTDAEKEDLLAHGWHPIVIESLALRGFRPCKPDFIEQRFEPLDLRHACGFLRQTSLPHLHISITKTAQPAEVMEAIDTAIYEAGQRTGHESLAGDFMRFYNRCKAWRPTPSHDDLITRIQALEAKVGG